MSNGLEELTTGFSSELWGFRVLSGFWVEWHSNGGAMGLRDLVCLPGEKSIGALVKAPYTGTTMDP